MKRKTAFFVIGAFAFSLLVAAPAFAGGALETIDITGNTPSPIPGHVVARVIGIKWDPRCIPVQYRMNNTQDPIPNPLAPFNTVMTLAQATTATQASLAAWNTIPTSFINMQVMGTVANLGFRGFDFVNEVTFRTTAGFSAIASSPSTSLIEDSTFVHGDDIDGDLDSDVSNAISVCTDVDNDGDNEFPAGFYKAGTILDNDVQYNTKVSNGFRFTADPAAADTVTRSVDFICVAVHEHGHSFGLSHVLDNQISATDGNGSTMFPFIDTGDPVSELSQRTPAVDDIAFAAYFYPEGSANAGPGALQAGDVDFDDVWGLIRGEARHGPLNQPLAGGSLQAITHGGERLVSAFSGTTQVSYNPATGGLFLISPSFNILNGNYVIPVPSGVYTVGIEAVDGSPVAASSISLTTQIGVIFGQHDFQEEFFDRQESDVEKRIGDADNVQVSRGGTRDGVDLITNRTIDIKSFGAISSIGFTLAPGGRYYAVQIRPADMQEHISELIHAGIFYTSIVDASVVPVFAEAILTTGTVSPGPPVAANINLSRPIERVTGFIGQDGDFAPLYFQNPHQLGKDVWKGINKGDIQNLFLVLRLPAGPPFPGVSNRPPLIGLSAAAPIAGRSFISDNGGATWTQVTNFNFMFGLVTGGDPNH